MQGAHSATQPARRTREEQGDAVLGERGLKAGHVGGVSITVL